MSEELYHTSAPRGVRPGASGFCTVAMTPGISATLEERLTLLSGYRWIYPAAEANSVSPNPIAWAHWRLPLGGKMLSILSRVADAGVDYSRRSNRFAHHLVLDAPEQIEAGPAWLLRQPEVMESKWNGEPQMLLSNRPLPFASNPPRSCAAWAAASGDAGWGGVLAESFLSDPGRIAWIIFPPEADLLALFDESLSLIPAARRWDVTFNTYFTDLPAGLSCAWRGCPAGSRVASEAIRNSGAALVIDLTRRAPLADQTAGASAGRIGVTLVGPDREARGEVATTRRSLSRPLPMPIRSAVKSAEPDLIPVDNEQGERSAPATVTQLDEWMPPTSSTVIEYASPPGNRGAVRTRVWLFGGLLLLIAAGAVIWFADFAPSSVTSPVASSVTAPRVVVVDPAPVVPATVPADTQRLADVESKLADLTSQNQSLRTALSTATTQLATLSAKDSQIAQLTAELTQAKSALVAATSRPSVAPNPLPSVAVPAFSVLDDRQLLWQTPVGLPAPDRIELAAPDAPAGIVVVRLSPARMTLRPAGKALAVDAAGNIVATDLAAAELKNGRLTFEWLDKRRFRQIDQAANWLALSRVSIFHEKNEVAGVQVVAPFNINLNVADVVAILPDLRGASADALKLLAPLDSTGDWTVHATADPLIVGVSNVRFPAAHFDVSVELAGPVATVRATWRERRASLSGQPDELAAMDALPPMTFRIRFAPTDVIVATIAMALNRALK